ncbi:MAG: restriction endonuclease [Gammaproteobacteria bacterium]|nr:restriction endonuclease [Gammaproteobacteria bacterium]
MEILTVTEHDTLPIDNSQKIGQKAISRKYSDALSRLEKLLPKKAWTWGHKHIKFGNYCGVISLGNLTIEILPKIYGRETNKESSRDVLVKMLYRARRLKLQRTGSTGINLQRHNLLDVFILHFCDQLYAEMTQGMIRSYIERNENLNVLRGRLCIEQHLKHNLAHHERLFCQYDELSVDNVHNRILKFVLNILLKKASGNRTHQQVSELLMRFEAISDITIVDSDMLDTLNFDRSTSRYGPIFEQCKWFLANQYPDVMKGKETCVSLLFNMNQLFEAYIGFEFRKKAWSEGLKVREQGPQKYFVKRMDTGQNVFRMKPDFTFLRDKSQIVAIADAKWKLLDEKEKKLGLSQPDLYQIQSYATRYDVKKVFLVYPMQREMKSCVELSLIGSGTNLIIIPIDVCSKSCKILQDLSIKG